MCIRTESVKKSSEVICQFQKKTITQRTRKEKKPATLSPWYNPPLDVSKCSKVGTCIREPAPEDFEDETLLTTKELKA